MQSQTLTQKRDTQAIQQLGGNANILEFLMMFNTLSLRSRQKLEDTILLLNNNLKTLKLNSFLSHDKLPIPAKIFWKKHMCKSRKVEILSGVVLSLTLHARLYCDTERLSEEGGFGFAPRIHLPVLAYAKMLQWDSDKYQLYCCKQNYTTLKLLLAVKLGEIHLIQQSFPVPLLNTIIQSFVTFEKQKYQKQVIRFACCILDKPQKWQS